jgi:hypothetical protein
VETVVSSWGIIRSIAPSYAPVNSLKSLVLSSWSVHKSGKAVMIIHSFNLFTLVTEMGWSVTQVVTASIQMAWMLSILVVEVVAI